MPHNLYLHSSIVQTRAIKDTDEDKAKAIKYATWDSTLSLGLAFFINAGILILAAAASSHINLSHCSIFSIHFPLPLRQA